MDVVYPRCSGLDVHKKTVVACVIVPGAKGKPQKTIRTFGTMTGDLLALGDWLAEQEVTHVAMESIGVYWQPIWNLLEERFTLLLVNAHQAGPRAQDGCWRLRVDCRSAAAWFAQGQLRPGSNPARASRLDPLSDGAHAGAGG